jgi:serine protease AprX
MMLFASRLFAQQAVLGPSLTETLDVAAPLDQLEVVVSFDQEGPLTLAQRLSLQSLGLKGTYFRSLPMAGVVATPAQINALLTMDGVRSVWHNDPLTYENDSATALSGVDALREDAQFQSMNGGVPFSGKGVGVMINDSGVDGTHEDLKYNVVQNVSGHLSLRDFTTLAPYVFVAGMVRMWLVSSAEVGRGLVACMKAWLPARISSAMAPAWWSP